MHIPLSDEKQKLATHFTKCSSDPLKLINIKSARTSTNPLNQKYTHELTRAKAQTAGAVPTHFPKSQVTPKTAAKFSKFTHPLYQITSKK